MFNDKDEEGETLTSLDDSIIKLHRLATKEEMRMLALGLEKDYLKPNRLVPRPHLTNDEKIEYYVENTNAPVLIIELQNGLKLLKYIDLDLSQGDKSKRKFAGICEMTFILTSDNKKLYWIKDHSPEMFSYDLEHIITEPELYELFWEDNG